MIKPTTEAKPEAEAKQVEVPIRPISKETQVEVPVPLAVEEAVPVVINNVVYDYSLKYYPRVGEDESGPRVEPGVVV